MSTEVKSSELQEQKKESPDGAVEGNQYKIIDYFKERTSLLVTCVSALVAIMSFVLHFAVSRMNYAYLAYWGIASLHANTNNRNELDMVLCALLYTLSLFLIHIFLGKTSDVYRHYNQLLSMVKQSIKLTKKTNKQFSKKLSECEDQFNILSATEKDTAQKEEVKKRIEECKELLDKGKKGIRKLIIGRIKLYSWVVIQIMISIVLSYFFGSLFLLLLNITVSIQESIRLTRIIVFIIFVDLFIYFVPSYFATRCIEKNLTNEEVLAYTAELLSNDIPSFPIRQFARNGLKSIFSDRIIKIAAFMSLVITTILLFALTIVGTLSAEQQRSFPIYKTDSASYAIVYTSGSTRFMEEATIKDGMILIDTTKQRIITTDDIAYTIEVFDSVSIIRIDDAQKNEQTVVSLESIIETISSIFETIKAEIGQVLAKDVAYVPRT